MRLTIFTSNQPRHNYFINLLSKYCDHLFVVQECNTVFTGYIEGQYKISNTMQIYFNKVLEAQKKLFKKTYININKNKISILPILSGDLKKCDLINLDYFLKSDLYIVFGSSYIKGNLIDYLIDKKAINIHMGISPYYRGTDCNFWAMYDGNPHLVGATIHLLSQGLDNGPILYHALSNTKKNIFEYTMSTVKSAIHSIAEKIDDKSIFNIDPLEQDKDKELRYSKKKDFNDEIIKKFLNKKFNLNKIIFNKALYKDPYIYS